MCLSEDVMAEQTRHIGLPIGHEFAKRALVDGVPPSPVLCAFAEFVAGYRGDQRGVLLRESAAMTYIALCMLTKSKAAIFRGLMCACSSALSYLHLSSELWTVSQIALPGSFSDAGLKKLAIALAA